MRTVIGILRSHLCWTLVHSLCLLRLLYLLTVEGTCDSNRAMVIFILDYTWRSEIRVAVARSQAQNMTIQGDAN